MNKNIKEWRTIEGLQVDKDWLQQENDNLRAQVLQAPDAKMVAFIAAFELWLEGEIDRVSTNAVEMNNMQDAVKSVALVHVSANFNRLKAQHLGDDSEGE